MRSTNVDQVLPNISGMFLWLSKTKSIIFGRSKTVSNILIRCYIASDDINNFCVCDWFHKFSTKSKKSHKLLISSETMGHGMKMFDTVLERPKVIVLVCESRRNTLVMLHNIWSTSVGLIVDLNQLKYEYYWYIWGRIVIRDEFLCQIFFWDQKVWIISFQTHYQPCFYDI